MRNIKLTGWLCMIVIILNVLAWPGQAAGVSENQFLPREPRELFDFDLPIQDSPSGPYPPGRALDEDDFFVEKQDREVRLWEAVGNRVHPLAFPLPDLPESGASNQRAVTCTVTSTADSGAGTLRACLADAVAGDLITFNPTNFPPGDPQTINLASNLPGTKDNVIIDASNAGVILNGSAISGDAFGLVIWGAQGVTIRGLQILNFTLGILIGNGASYNTIGGDRAVGSGPLGQGNRISGNSEVGVWLQSVGTSNNTIRGNFIGTDLTGNAAMGNGYAGLVIVGGATQNVVGGSHSPGSCDGACNLISGNQVGIQIEDTDMQGNQVLGNFIGTNLQGNSANPNSIAGMIIWDAPGNHVGGAGSPGVCDGPCNLISGNGNRGIAFQGYDSDNNQVQGNFIGTTISGTAPLPNYDGLIIADGSGNQIGGAGSGEGNLISGNEDIGLWITSKDTTNNIILGNRIGTDISGTLAIPNYEGILIQAGTGNQVGGAAAGAGNLISGNEEAGIYVEYVNPPGITMAGNKIGTNLSGTAALPNYYGILLVGGGGNLIGGTTPGSGNLISGNTKDGIRINTSSTNRVQGNTIGANQSGSAPIPNQTGIFIGFGACNNIIGGGTAGMGNVISGNTWDGIFIQNETSVGNQLLGNRIGTNRGGTSALPNDNGVVVISARETIIGGADLSTPWACDGPCNLISGNTSFGITNQGVSAGGSEPPGTVDMGSQVLGNFIGTDLSGTSAIPNLAGVDLSYQAGGNRVGGSSPLGEGNLLSGNQYDGVVIRDLWANDNQVCGNRIGTKADGNAALPNGENGVKIYGSASGNVIGGESAGLGNLISGNALFGISLSGENTTSNQILGNQIGTNAAGTNALPNLIGGIRLLFFVSGTEIRGNVISGNEIGLFLHQSSDNVVSDNHIGVAADGQSPLPNGEDGIWLDMAPHNTIGPGNTIAYNLYGVSIVEPESVGNTITQNSIYANTITQIAFFNVPVPLAPAPLLSSWNEVTMTVTGTACVGCQVEVFTNPTSTPAGHTYLGTATTAGDGSFSLTLGAGYIYLAATATDAEGTTSAFSNVLQIGEDINVVYLPLILK